MTATITNDGYTPPSNVLVTLQWDGTDIGGSDEPGSLLSGAGGVNTITVLAGETSGTLIVSKSNDELFSPTQTAALTATHPGGQIGSEDVTLKDDDDPPVLTIGLANATITEGEKARLNLTLSRGYATLTKRGDGELCSAFRHIRRRRVICRRRRTIPSDFVRTGYAEHRYRVQTRTTTPQRETPREVVFTIIENTDLYTVGTPASVTLTVLDNDTKPSVPQNIEAEPNYTVVALTWDDPAEDGDQTITKYEYRYSDDSRTTWGPGTGNRGMGRRPDEQRGRSEPQRLHRHGARERHDAQLRGARGERRGAGHRRNHRRNAHRRRPGHSP